MMGGNERTRRNTRCQRQRRRRTLLILALAILLSALILIVKVRADAEKQMAVKLENAQAAMVMPPVETPEPKARQVNESVYDVPAAEPVTYEALSPVEVISKAVYGEAGICSTTEQAAVVWCICNRVDAGYGDLVEVTTAPYQFHGYDEDNPVTPEIEALVQDVLIRWRMEESCIGNVGRVLPKEYLFFSGDGRHNYFRTEWDGGTRWDWSLPSPYEEDNK